jgi:hypothetical protein
VPKTRKQKFDHLSPAESQVVGVPDDYDWDHAIDLPARPRSDSVQFSVRVDREAFVCLHAISRERNTTFSDTVREAIARYVRTGGKLALTNVQVSFRRDQGMLVQVPGRRAEVPTSRRQVGPNERAELAGVDPVRTF